MSKVIAKRELLYSLKGESLKKKIKVLIHEPRDVSSEELGFAVHSGASVCKVEIVGLPEKFSDEVHGADSIQALSMASDVEGYLKYFQRKYDLYWGCGESYFDNEDSL
ncbi:hypothetical protein [Pseudoteredinibacter isoporae]|uniref:Uncharacterized protein n=1 Tax=Pseudoteredinibacter isoporae TaxID=570281 RepID=A0A7X0JWQ4_9GAMM|nr:hypothetical protein [Pseudoteredinibacter isoporae]MBB6522821.1 hypothetical protein [Pseudoteredinibacter isoporae]NHO88348.1 hypothetical protein [Pseudoteredinibacter isoporae]NIB23321.1 hypothetical protein [Pseudoteredinibacter isoporae]